MFVKVLNYIQENNLIEDEDRVIVGVSGGADSICLLFMLLDMQSYIDFSIFVVHIEHGIRGEQSLEDAAFVKKLCEDRHIPYYQFSYSVEEMAQKEKMTVEEAGRKVRYLSFAKTADEVKGNKIAVAHHQNDQAETVLFQLFRGSRLKGLGGIQPRRDMVIRPLLCIGRKEIEEYLGEKNIAYRTDSTNEEAAYTRNKIRLELIPYIEREINPQAVAHLAETAGALREIEEFMAVEARQRYEKIVRQGDDGEISVDIESLLSESAVMQKYILRLCIKACAGKLKDITSGHIEDLRKICILQSGKKICLPYGIQAVKNYGCLFINVKKEKKIQDFCMDVSIPGNYVCQDIEINFLVDNYKKSLKKDLTEKKIYTKSFDYDTIKGRLQVRTRRAGDYYFLRPDGGKKSLKSFFIDEKIPQVLRSEILLLADGSHVIWIIGYRISEACKISDSTKRILKVHVVGGKEYGLRIRRQS